ncbi:MAG: mucoidy inhibitor MuiA family protein [Coriobacteriales bacterium]|nr:mucoidy inhibitor MuiA family protein [Coriobacteriales bacterium]
MTEPIQTKLFEVSVHFGGCVTTRRGKVALEQGRNYIYIAGITSRVQGDSIRMRFPKGITQGQIRICEEIPGFDGLLSEDAQNLKTAYELDENIASLEADIETCDVELELWKHNGMFSYAGSGVTPTDAIAYMELLPGRLRKIEQRRRDLTNKLKQTNAQLEEHLQATGIRRKTPWDGMRPDRTLAPSRSQKAASPEFIVEKDLESRYIFAELWAESAGTYAFDVQCWQTGATWAPLYEAAADTAAESIDLRMRARVTQTTKEDWSQIHVRLCSGNPSVTSNMPIQQPIYLDLERNMPHFAPSLKNMAPMADSVPMSGRAKWGGRMSGNTETFEAVCDEEAAQEEPLLERVQVFDASKRNRQTMVEYELPGLWDIASGTEGQIVDLERHQVNAQFHHYVFPRVDGQAYLAAHIDTIQELFPLDGTMSCYLEGMLTGNTSIDAEKVLAPGFEVPFGRSSQISVKRKLTELHTSQPTLKNLTLTTSGYEIEVTNTQNSPVNAVIVDQIPVARDSSITVEVNESGGAAITSKSGEVRWNLELAPSETRTLKLSYTISYPKRETLVNFAR